MKGLSRVVVSPWSRVGILKALHDDVGHWDLTETLKIVTDTLWWTLIKQGVE